MPWGRGVPGQVQLGREYPYPIMFCNITQNSMGQTPRGGTWPGPAKGVPCQVRMGGTLPGGVPCQGMYPGRVHPPGQVRMGVPPWARSGQGDTLLGGVTPPGSPWQGTPSPPPGQVRTGVPRTTEGVLTTRRAVCLLHSHRRTFLFYIV